MDQLQQCAVCTLYLHSGMSMEEHLDTHPKDQVIRALCKMAERGFSSRCTTPAQSERSYSSRAPTPSTVKPFEDKDRRKRLQRTPTRCETPMNTFHSETFYEPSKSETMQSCFVNKSEGLSHSRSGTLPLASNYYMQDVPEEIELKYSRSDEYNHSHSRDVFTHTVPKPRLQAASHPRPETRVHDIPHNIAVMKANAPPVQYMNSGVKPFQFMMSTPASLVQTQQNTSNMMISNSNVNEMLPVSKGAVGPIFSQIMTSEAGPFTPGTTVVTQNSQFYYREMVQNIDGKSYLSAVPAVVSVRDDMTSNAQTPNFHNVMVVNPYPNATCMYPPQHLVTAQNLSNYEQPVAYDKRTKSVRTTEPNTLIIEVGPIGIENATVTPLCDKNQLDTHPLRDPRAQPGLQRQQEPSHSASSIIDGDKSHESTSDMSKTKKGLKILSNIKVEVPIAHHKSMLHGVMDLTGDSESRVPTPVVEPPALTANETISSDLDESKSQPEFVPSTEVDSGIMNAFSVIKNIGNPGVYRDSPSKCSYSDPKIDDQNDSSSIPDLTCKEKASISPCSELSGDFADNSLDSNPCTIKMEPTNDTIQVYKHIPLSSNSFMQKPKKKILQIKNIKSGNSVFNTTIHPEPSTSQQSESTSKNMFSLPRDLMETFKQNNVQCSPTKSVEKDNTSEVIVDADTEERSMDIEPISHSTYRDSLDIPKEEGHSQDDTLEKKDFTQLETMRPVNVIAFGNMNSYDANKEYDAAKDRFVSLMTDNYFGENMIVDYFASERAGSFTRQERGDLAVQKTEINTEVDIPADEPANEYMWGESSQMLTTFETYKVSEYETGSLELEETQYAELRCRSDLEKERCEPPIDLCTDERREHTDGNAEPWTGMYHNMGGSTSYDLIARETWVSDSSEVDPQENADRLHDELEQKMSIVTQRTFKCTTCGQSFDCPKERRVHRAQQHPAPAAAARAPRSKLKSTQTTTLAIKEEEKGEELIISEVKPVTTVPLAPPNLADILQGQIKPDVVIKVEPRRRRRDYACPVCKVDFFTELVFNEHLKIHPLECLQCGKYFYRRANLQLHLRTHLAIKNYKCDVCEKRFTTKQKLLEHDNTHTGNAPVKCTHCTATFRRYSNMIQHRNRHHLQLKRKLRDFVCQCGEVFHSRRKLLWHKETHETKPKTCPYCSDKFVHAASLTRHIRRAHNSYFIPDDARARENIECPICKQVYLKNNIEMHLQTHTGKKPFSCVICNKTFSNKRNLKLHRWVHTHRSFKPYKCMLCKGAFIRQSDYVSHMNSHKSFRPYTCNYCGCQFIRKYNCQRHVKEHEQDKRYVCTVPECGKTFHRSYYLSEHMRVHSGARPFSCNICGKTSSNKSNHNKHVRIHHAREPVATEG